MRRLTDKEFFEVQEIREQKKMTLKKKYLVYVRENGKEKVTFLGCYKTIEAANKRIDDSKEAYKKNGFNGVLWIDYKGETK